MKKILAIAAIVAFSLSASAQSTVKWPWGKADFQTPTVTTKVTAQTITITNNLTYADLGVVDTNKVLTVSVNSGVDKGARLYVKVKSDATARAVTTSGTGCGCASTAGVISKTKIIEFVYDGTKFYCTGSAQID